MTDRPPDAIGNAVNTDFNQIVFSGGGIRCFWHGGFLAVAGDKLGLEVERVSTVSGGALSASAWIGKRETDLLELMHEAFTINDGNIDTGKSNLTPHQEIYRAVVETTLDREAIERIAHGPEYQVILAVPPKHVSAQASAFLFGVLYKLDQAVRSTPHLRWPTQSGLGRMRVDARTAAREGQLVDLICAAATIPPVFDVPTWAGRRVLDGGMTDKAPLPEPDEGRTLILLSSRYSNLPDDPRRTYVQPSEEVAADKIDFAHAERVKKTWGQGERDARSWLEQHGLGG